MRPRRSFLARMILFLSMSVSLTAVGQQDSPDDADSAATASPLYTKFDDAAQATFPEGTSRLALLIGNSAYDKAPRDTAHPHRLPLNSVTGCNDVLQIAKRLANIGWKKDEIVVLCDQSKSQIEVALTELSGAAPLGYDDQKLMLVYFAGHGVNVDEKNYFFGVNATPDYNQMASILVSNRLSRGTRQLFDRDAIDVLEVFTRRLGSLNYPLLVIVDTCRNNPFVRKTGTALANELAKHSEARRLAQLQFLVAGPARPTTGVPRGMSIVFATTPSNTIVDDGGTGVSRLTDALNQKIVAQKSINWVFQEVHAKLKLDNAALPDPALAQEILQDGQLWIDDTHGEWCFYGCGRPGASTHSQPKPITRSFDDTLRARLTDARAFWSASIAQTTASDQADTPPPKPTPAVLYRSEVAIAVGLRPMTLDIFWCAGGPDEASRYALARAFGQAVSADLRTQPQTKYGNSRFETVRLRPISESTNARPGYQRNDSSMYVDNDDADERTAADVLVRGHPTGLRVAPVNKRSPGYMSAFFCKDAFTSPTSPLLYVHVPSPAALPDASNIISFLDNNFDNLDVQRKAEVVPASPTSSEVRYYLTDHAEEAAEVAEALRHFTGVDVEAKNLCPQPERCRWPEAKQIEYWLGIQDAAKIYTLPPYRQVPAH